MPAPPASREELAALIDHAVLKPDATAADLAATCDLCARLGVGNLCVRPGDVVVARRKLDGSGVSVGTVIGFPHGIQVGAVKAAEARHAVDDGAEELDMVIPIGRLIDGDVDFVRDDIAGVVAAGGGRTVKVILECCYLTDEQIDAGCAAAIAAGADFVKTSTGFGTAGATVEAVARLRAAVGEKLGVKAAGGIRTLADALAMIEAGATRIGTSRSEAILAEWKDAGR
jgi:deoxyribose-phosphate aldolase